MNCYDCVQSGQATPAAAVCRRCGAAVCSEHTHVNTDIGYRRVLAVAPSPARRLTCTICHGAEHRTDRAGPARRLRRQLVGDQRRAPLQEAEDVDRPPQKAP